MASVLSTSSPVELDTVYSPETPLRGTTNNEDSVNCHPWDSRGRRLFPQRRPSIPTSVRRKANATPDFPLFETSPSRAHFPINHQEYDSDTSSQSSIGSVATVKVRMSPNPDRPFPKTDPRVGEDVRVRTPYRARSLPRFCSVERPFTPLRSSSKSLGTSFSAPLYTDIPARGNLEWESMAQFYNSGHRLRPRTLSQLPNGEQTPPEPEEPQYSPVPSMDTFEGKRAPDVVPYQWSQSPEINGQTGLLLIEENQGWGGKEETYVVAEDQSRSDVPVLKVATWDCTVMLSTSATVTGDGRLRVQHFALLSVIIPVEKLYAEKVGFSLVVTNALRNDHTRNLGPGQSSLLFKEDVFQAGFFPREGAELVIVRDSSDLESPLNLYFTFTYPSPHHFVMASLPTFRPKEGRSLSEVVSIAEPLPPLSMKTFIRDPLSSWKLCHHPVSQVTCYKRIELPRLYPAGFQDDIQMRILELDPVRFRALRGSTLSSVVWKLDITVHEVLGEQLECRMSFFLEVGAATALVSLVPHGWVPRYFVIDGRVATEKVGECWKNKEGHITIFKQAHMVPGPIMVETYWQGTPKSDKNDGSSTGSTPLPGVADRKVLGGRLTCRPNDIILLNHLNKRIRPHGPVDETHILLPTMDAGYKVLLRRATQAHSQQIYRPVPVRPPFLPIPEDTQTSDHTILHSDGNVERGNTASKVKGEVAPKHLLQALLLPLFVLLLLVPGLLLLVEHVRKETNHNERTSWKDQNPFTMSGDGQWPQAVIDVPSLDALQPASIAADNPVDVAKCEGWRDWVDYGSGWKGCIP